MSSNQSNGAASTSITNYCAYQDLKSKQRYIGSLSDDGAYIQPLAFASGTPLTNLYEVLEAGESRVSPSGDQIKAASVKLLPPIGGRDVLCVGKNYASHATEFNKSGYDSSDKTDQPTHPVIFTKRYTSIIAHGDEIYSHADFTKTADYEGELGVIIGKSGFRISEADAMEHVWGYTIINDMTARERQRDHKQFYLGKSPDTFCPMGPIAVPKEKVERVVRVQTRVNGNLRQNQTTDDLIFSIPYLIMTLSEAQTLTPGDVLATGTPAGVGFGQEPPTYLQPGDEVSISITGLGTLSNRIASKSSSNPAIERVKEDYQAVQSNNTSRTPNRAGLTEINRKPMHYAAFGNTNGTPAVFVHGLAGSAEYWRPLIEAGDLGKTHDIHLYDLEGHGLTPTSPLSEVTIASLAADLKGVFDHSKITGGSTLFAHSFGCLVAVKFVLDNPGRVAKLILLGPTPSPFPQDEAKTAQQLLPLARSKGMPAIVDGMMKAGISENHNTRTSNAIVSTTVRLMLLGQDPEGFAKMCSALIKSSNETLDFSKIDAETFILTGSEDVATPPKLCERYEKQLQHSLGLKVLQSVGHWHVFEDPHGVAEAVKAVL